MSGSFLIEIHSWKRFAKERDLFCIHFVAGFITVVICRRSITDIQNELRARIARAKKRIGGEE